MKLYNLQNQFLKYTNKYPNNLTGIVEYSDGTKEWFVDGKLHRLDGPACEGSDGSKAWYVDNEEVTKKQCKLLYSIMKLKGLM